MGRNKENIVEPARGGAKMQHSSKTGGNTATRGVFSQLRSLSTMHCRLQINFMYSSSENSYTRGLCEASQCIISTCRLAESTVLIYTWSGGMNGMESCVSCGGRHHLQHNGWNLRCTNSVCCRGCERALVLPQPLTNPIRISGSGLMSFCVGGCSRKFGVR